jgi:mRNA interferase HigB
MAFQRSASAAIWKNMIDLRQSYPHADAVTTASGRTIIVLNAAGNKYRLIVAAHFNRQVIYTLRFLTHAEYSKAAWRTEL